VMPVALGPVCTAGLGGALCEDNERGTAAVSPAITVRPVVVVVDWVLTVPRS